MNDETTFAERFVKAAADIEAARADLVMRLDALDKERAEIKALIGRKPRAAKSSAPKKTRKARITGIETSEQA